MLIIELFDVKITRKNIDWFFSLGYECVLGETIKVKSNHLTLGSTAMITFICDYCNGSKMPPTQVPFGLYMRRKKNIEKDACGLCKNLKQKDSVIKTYGVDNVNKIPEISEKVGSKQRLSIIEVAKIFSSKGYILLEKEKDYKNTNQKLRFLCLKHGEQFISLCSLHYNDHGCRACFFDSRRGEGHFNWKGGSANENLQLRGSADYYQWRKAVFMRDYYTCQCCGIKTGGNLQAHHIFNFSSNPTFRFDVNNGVTLCKDCHDPIIKGSFHQIYGRKDNTLEQLVEYFNFRKADNISLLYELGQKLTT